jgi:hypothetical protein
MSAIPVLYSFARSGGTLANQLLGTHPQCLVLSEVNPAGSFKPVAEQAIEWLQLATPAEAAELSAMPYRRQVALLRDRASQRGRTLVVRDWVTANFLPGTAPRVAPSGTLEQDLYLRRAGLEPIAVVVSRRAAAVYKSIVANFAHLKDLTVEAFADAYLAYARAVADLPRVHMESLRAAPEAGVRRLFEAFGLDAAAVPGVLRDFHEFRECTGNTTLEGRGGSADARTVLPPEDTAGLPTHPALAQADALLGYER